MPIIKVHNLDLSVEDGITALDISGRRENSSEILVCRVNGKLRDLSSPVKDGDCVEFLTFEDEEAKRVFWHSSAHVLGCAILSVYPDALLSSGPATEEGFFYDVRLAQPFTQEDYAQLEKAASKVIRGNHVFHREAWKKDALLKEYERNPYKTHFVATKVDGESSVYRVKDFADMCQGPHIHSTSAIKAFKILKNSSSYFLGDAANDSLQRIFGISFPRKEMMDAFLHFRERAKMLDHRRLGLELDLFFFHPYSPGSAFFLPEGAFIYNSLVEFIRGEYKKRGYEEVISPNIFSLDLWKESGHLDNYKENMFLLEGGMGLKPMNCPGHCLMFRHVERTFRDLPMRIADFGVLHRNELRGALSGLTRVRRFQQDDAHIFCTMGQIEAEIRGCVDFLEHVYQKLGFKFETLLSTRPEKFLGSVHEWEAAEDALRRVLRGREYELNEGDGAFYGPKIDVVVLDALKRKHQCGTIQLDFQLPQRFGLKFKKSDGSYEAPVMVHRAIFGSIERMMAILIENYGKRLPFWLNPRQVALIAISGSVSDYVDEVRQRFRVFRTRVFDEEGLTLNKKIRNAQTRGYSVVVFVGEREKQRRNVSVRVGNETREYEIDDIFETLHWRLTTPDGPSGAGGPGDICRVNSPSCFLCGRAQQARRMARKTPIICFGPHPHGRFIYKQGDSGLHRSRESEGHLVDEGAVDVFRGDTEGA